MTLWHGIQIGFKIRLEDGPDEEERYGTIVDARTDGVTIDTNEELVGRTLILHVSMLGIQEGGVEPSKN